MYCFGSFEYLFRISLTLILGFLIGFVPLTILAYAQQRQIEEMQAEIPLQLRRMIEEDSIQRKGR